MQVRDAGELAAQSFSSRLSKPRNSKFLIPNGIGLSASVIVVSPCLHQFGSSIGVFDGGVGIRLCVRYSIELPGCSRRVAARLCGRNCPAGCLPKISNGMTTR